MKTHYCHFCLSVKRNNRKITYTGGGFKCLWRSVTFCGKFKDVRFVIMIDAIVVLAIGFCNIFVTSSLQIGFWKTCAHAWKMASLVPDYEDSSLSNSEDSDSDSPERYLFINIIMNSISYCLYQILWNIVVLWLIPIFHIEFKRYCGYCFVFQQYVAPVRA